MVEFPEQFDWCRPLVDCSAMCYNLSAIDILDPESINPEMFRARYAKTGRPLLVRNATNWWPAVDAFTFEFLRDVYEELDRYYANLTPL